MGPKIISAPCLEFPAWHRDREARLSELRLQDDQEMRELHRDRILEMCREFPSRIQLSPAHGCKKTKEAAERTTRKYYYTKTFFKARPKTIYFQVNQPHHRTKLKNICKNFKISSPQQGKIHNMWNSIKNYQVHTEAEKLDS